MNEQLIEKLAGDLKPTAPVRSSTTVLQMLAAAMLGGAALLGIIGLRPDAAHATASFFVYWKSGIFLLIGTGAVLTLVTLSIPGRSTGLAGPVLMTAGISGLAALAASGFVTLNNTNDPFAAILHGTKFFCLASVLGLGSVLLAFALLLLRRLAVTRPRVSGFLSGIASGSFAAGAYAWHCMVDQPIYITVWYTLPVLILGAIGAIIGPKFLRF